MSTTRPEAARSQGGFSIIAAIFILVVLAALGGFIVSTSSTQHLSLALDVMNSRAHQAARAGLEWGVYQIVKVAPVAGNFPADCNLGSGYLYSVTPPVAAARSETLSGLAGLPDFTVVVACDSKVFNEGADTYRVYQITATACNTPTCPSTSPGFAYVEHQQRARVKMP